MTLLSWERLKKILNKWAVTHLIVSSSDPRQSTHITLVEAISTIPNHSLHELILSNISIEHFQRFLLRQQTLESLSITGEVLTPELINFVMLKRLKLVGPKSKRLTRIIHDQPNLTSFKLAIDEETEYNNEVFSAIVSLKELEVLDIPLNDNISFENVTNLSMLKNLTKLSVSCSAFCFQTLVITRITSLIELDVTLNEPCCNNSVKLLANNVPNLKLIKFRGPLVVNFLNEFIEYFSQLRSLWIENDESYFVNFVNLITVETSHLKLKHLFIVNHDRKVVLCANDLMKFVKMFTELETLVIRKLIDIHLKNFEFLLRNLPSLREIVINSKFIDSTTKVMNIINKYGTNLKFIELENFRLQSDTDSLKTFFEGKFPIIEKENNNLILQKHEQSFLRKIIND